MLDLASARHADVRAEKFIGRLVVSDVLSEEQGEYLLEIWPEVATHSFSHPLLRAVSDHTRAVLEQIASSSRARRIHLNDEVRDAASKCA
jgi:hypothetical protein